MWQPSSSRSFATAVKQSDLQRARPSVVRPHRSTRRLSSRAFDLCALCSRPDLPYELVPGATDHKLCQLSRSLGTSSRVSPATRHSVTSA